MIPTFNIELAQINTDLNFNNLTTKLNTILNEDGTRSLMLNNRNISKCVDTIKNEHFLKRYNQSKTIAPDIITDMKIVKVLALNIEAFWLNSFILYSLDGANVEVGYTPYDFKKYLIHMKNVKFPNL